MVSTSGKPFEWNKLVPELDVSDFERSLQFYTDVLGFEVLFTRENFAYLELEDIQFMLQEPSGDGWKTGDLDYPYGRGINFQIELSDIAPLYERFKAADYQLFQDIKDTWRETAGVLSGQREFLIQDPDGYLLRFCQALGEKPYEVGIS